MRGEEAIFRFTNNWDTELPPHARRRGDIELQMTMRHGITSACAEKSNAQLLSRHQQRNYLRMRGEEGGVKAALSGVRELPPHARRRVISRPRGARAAGITSACAEKRIHPASQPQNPRNYLRMRGEESTTHLMTFPSAELPPHARRRGLVFPMPAPFSGITSACAEKSCSTCATSTR